MGGGYSHYAVSLALVLKRLGYVVTIVSLGRKTTTTRVNSIPVSILKVPLLSQYWLLPGLPFYSYLLAKEIYRTSGSSTPIIVWGIGPWSLTGVWVSLMKKTQVYRVASYFTLLVHEWHKAREAVQNSDYSIWIKLIYAANSFFVVPVLSLCERFALIKTDHIVTHYASTDEILEQAYPETSGKRARLAMYVTLPKKVKRSLKKARNLPRNYILCVARQSPRKGVNVLLHALTRIKRFYPGVLLVIVGTGELLDANKTLARRLNLEENVRFLGFVDVIDDLLGNAKMFCLPSLEEGAGSVALNEAMAFGLPIVASACDGIVEDIKDNETGLLVPPGDPDRLARAILRLIRNPKLAKNLGARAKREFAQRFSLPPATHDMKRFLEQVL